MAPVVWGLDLAEIKWSKFKSSYMWNSVYHLRRTKFIVYQCALIFCVVSESIGTAALSDYSDAQDFVQHLDPRVYVYNDDYIGAASYNIFPGIFVAFVFGAAFFFDLFWPERHESRGVRLSWKICAVLAVLFQGASAFALTIITAIRCQRFSGPGVTLGEGAALLSQFRKDGGVPICYRDNGRAVAAVVFVWLGFVSVVGSCVLLFLSIQHTESGLGPKSRHVREEEELERAKAEAQMSSDVEKQAYPGSTPISSGENRDIAAPAPTAVAPVAATSPPGSNTVNTVTAAA